MTPFYLPQYGFSVREHNGSYVLVCRLPQHREARSDEEVRIVEAWAAKNRARYQELA